MLSNEFELLCEGKLQSWKREKIPHISKKCVVDVRGCLILPIRHWGIDERKRCEGKAVTYCGWPDIGRSLRITTCFPYFLRMLSQLR